MKPKLSKRKRLLRGCGILIVVVLLLLYIVLPAAFGGAAIWPENDNTGNPPDGFSEVTLTTSDDVKLAAWYAPPTNGAAIILIHGAGSGRQSVKGYAEMLRDNGFGVLAISTRGFSDSEGSINRLGWQGTLDVGAALAFLQTQPDVEAIGGLGISMGGEILLGAASAYPQIQAIISDGATFRSLEEYKALPANRSLWRNFTSRVLYLSVRILSGDAPPKPLLDSMQDAENTQFMYIAAEDEDTEVEFNERFLEQVGEDRAELWVVPDVAHTGGFGKHREDYEARVVAFFESHLLRSEP